MPRVSGQRFGTLLLLVPFAVYLVGLILLGNWIMDDAGISFAYARNVAGGHGLVSQPGRVPVEGFSNFLWVVLLVPFFWARLFHPIVTVKVLAAVMVLVAIAVIQRVLRRATGSAIPGLLAVLLLATAPPIVIWTGSGLENGLMLLLIVFLWAVAVERPRRWGVLSGVLAALLAMTRPDGLLYVIAGPLVLAAEILRRRIAVRQAARDLAEHVGAFAGLFVPFMVLRLSLFGLPFPHTYYAKRMYVSEGDHVRAVLRDPGPMLTKAWDLCRGIAGPLGPYLAVAMLATLVGLAIRRRMPRHVAIAAILSGVAGAAYLWLDDDWMGEYRFATAAVGLSFVTFVSTGTALANRAAERSSRRPIGLLLTLLCGVITITTYPRLVRFAGNPPMSFSDVQRQYAERFNAYAVRLGVPHRSILLADIGGTLMDSNLTVFDLGGLCEPAVVQKLRKGTNIWYHAHPEFYGWVFDDIKPTFITTHAFWTKVSAFEYDPRFARDYVAIESYKDEYVKAKYHRDLYSGDFVRRDALDGVATLDELRASYSPGPRTEPLVHRLADAWTSFRLHGGSEQPEELRKAALAALRQHDPNRAAALLARLLETAPDDIVAAQVRAQALDGTGRTAEARLEWTRVARLAEQRPDTVRAGLALSRLGGVTETTTLATGDEEARLMQAGLDALYRDHEPERAIQRFLSVLRIRNTHYGAHYQLAVALDRAGKSSEARRLWRKVLEMAEFYKDAATASAARDRLQRPD